MQAVYESLAIESLQGKQKKQIDLGRGEMYLTQHSIGYFEKLNLIPYAHCHVHKLG
jgi:hypothetical protein